MPTKKCLGLDREARGRLATSASLVASPSARMAENMSACFCVGKVNSTSTHVYCLQRGNFPFSSSSAPGPPPAVTSRKRSRFDLISEADMNIMKKGYTPPKTEASTKLALRIINSGKKIDKLPHRNKSQTSSRARTQLYSVTG